MRPYVNISFPGRGDGTNAKILKAMNLLLRVGKANLAISEELMSAISDFAAAQTAFQQRMDTAMEGIRADITAMNEQIAILQNSGTISDADQASLNELHTMSETLATKLEEIDAMKPPVPPSA